MRIVIVTGMSGAGKSTALNNMEDLGYFCVDNLPVLLLDKLADMIQDSSFTYDKVAIGIDIRSGKELDNLSVVLSNIKSSGIEYEILFLDASTENLIRRFKETRREHPLANGTGEIEDAIRKERDRVAFLKDSADYIIDTTGLLTRELKKEINKIFVKGEGYSNIIVSLVSFGFPPLRRKNMWLFQLDLRSRNATRCNYILLKIGIKFKWAFLKKFNKNIWAF